MMVPALLALVAGLRGSERVAVGADGRLQLAADPDPDADPNAPPPPVTTDDTSATDVPPPLPIAKKVNIYAPIEPMPDVAEKAFTAVAEAKQVVATCSASVGKVQADVVKLTDAKHAMQKAKLEDRTIQTKVAEVVPVMETFRLAAQLAERDMKQAKAAQAATKHGGLPTHFTALAVGKAEAAMEEIVPQLKEQEAALYGDAGLLADLEASLDEDKVEATKFFNAFQDLDMSKFAELSRNTASALMKADAALTATSEAYSVVLGQAKDYVLTAEDLLPTEEAGKWHLDNEDERDEDAAVDAVGDAAAAAGDVAGADADTLPVDDATGGDAAGDDAAPTSFVQFDDYDEGEQQAEAQGEQVAVQQAEAQGEAQEDQAEDQAEDRAEDADEAAASSFLETPALVQKKAGFDDYDEQPDQAQEENAEVETVQAAEAAGAAAEERAEDAVSTQAGEAGEAAAETDAPSQSLLHKVAVDPQDPSTDGSASYTIAIPSEEDGDALNGGKDWSSGPVFEAFYKLKHSVLQVTVKEEGVAKLMGLSMRRATECQESVTKLNGLHNLYKAAQHNLAQARTEMAADQKIEILACCSDDACPNRASLDCTKSYPELNDLKPLERKIADAFDPQNTEMVVAVEKCRQSVAKNQALVDQLKVFQQDLAKALDVSHNAMNTASEYKGYVTNEVSSVKLAIKDHKAILWNPGSDEYDVTDEDVEATTEPASVLEAHLRSGKQ